MANKRARTQERPAKRFKTFSAVTVKTTTPKSKASDTIEDTTIVTIGLRRPRKGEAEKALAEITRSMAKSAGRVQIKVETDIHHLKRSVFY